MMGILKMHVELCITEIQVPWDTVKNPGVFVSYFMIQLDFYFSPSN